MKKKTTAGQRPQIAEKISLAAERRPLTAEMALPLAEAGQLPGQSAVAGGQLAAAPLDREVVLRLIEGVKLL